MTSWFRSWHGAPTDNKWLVIAAKAKVKPGVVSAVAWALFDHASQADERGSVKEFDTETYAVFSGFGENEVQAVIAAMLSKGVIDENGRLHAWDKRQPKREDDSAERVRRHRENKKAGDAGSNGSNDGNDSADGVTQCNARKRTETHVTHTEPDTETDKKVVVVVGTPPPPPNPRYNHVCKLIEGNGFGMLTPLMAEKVHGMIDEFPDEWIDKSFEVAVNANKRRLDYVLGTLENWRRDGFGSKPQPKSTGYANGNGRGAPVSKVDKTLANAAALREMLKEGGTL